MAMSSESEVDEPVSLFSREGRDADTTARRHYAEMVSATVTGMMGRDSIFKMSAGEPVARDDRKFAKRQRTVTEESECIDEDSESEYEDREAAEAREAVLAEGDGADADSRALAEGDGADSRAPAEGDGDSPTRVLPQTVSPTRVLSPRMMVPTPKTHAQKAGPRVVLPPSSSSSSAVLPPRSPHVVPPRELSSTSSSCPNFIEIEIPFSSIKYVTNPGDGTTKLNVKDSPITPPHEELIFKGYIFEGQIVKALFAKMGYHGKGARRRLKPTGTGGKGTGKSVSYGVGDTEI